MSRAHAPRTAASQFPRADGAAGKLRAARRAEAREGFPPALIGGESLSGAKVDWLTVTWLPEPDEHIPAMAHDLLKGWLAAGVQGVDCPGMFGYKSGVRFFVKLDDGKEHHVARVDFGGTQHNGRARFDLSGSACARVTQWLNVQTWIGAQFDAKITRVDLAVDCLQGEYTVEDAAEWYKAGLFNAGGRMPRHSTIGDWLSDTTQHGRTLEVGKRGNGKMLRAYEKGRQLGDPNSTWTRFEVEIRNIDRDVPLDVLTRCDEYFVGAYKCLETILEASAERIATHQKEGEISLEKLTHHAREAYGTTVHVLRATLTADEVLAAISRPGVPKRLEKASLAGFIPKAPPVEERATP